MFLIVRILVAFSLLFANGAAMGHAMCVHADAKSHAAALNSDDGRQVSAARAEEMASKAASKAGTKADFAVPAVGVLNAAPAPARQADLATANWVRLPATPLPGRSTAPPSKPPLN